MSITTKKPSFLSLETYAELSVITTIPNMRKNSLLSNHYYHIYNRGVNYGNIFFEQENWSFFLDRLKHYFHPILVSVVAYCLMPNHYHLLVFLKTNTFGLDVMQPFTVSYTKAINKQQGRVGPLFQGPYKAKQLENNSYLLHLSRYIHLNPVTAGLVTVPEAWEYSSYGEYIGMRSSTFIKSEVLIDQFPNRDAYTAFVYNQRGPGDGLPVDLLLD